MRRIILALALVVIPAARWGWAAAEEPLETPVLANEQQPELSAEDLEVIKNMDILENWDVLQEEEAVNVESDEQASTGEDHE